MTWPPSIHGDVRTKVDNHESRLTAVEGATSLAGVEIGSAQLTANYDILGQASGATTFGDIGLSIAVAAQTRAYNVSFGCTIVLVTSSSFVGPKYASAVFRIVDSAGTVVADVSQFPVIIIPSGVSQIFAKAVLNGRIPAGRSATTWKVQSRLAPAPDAQITSLGIWGGPALAAPAGGVSATPAQLQAITV